MKQLLLTDEEIQVLTGLLLSVPFASTGSGALKNATHFVTKLEQAIEFKEPDLRDPEQEKPKLVTKK